MSINTIVHKIRHELSEMCLCTCVGLLSTNSYFSPYMVVLIVHTTRVGYAVCSPCVSILAHLIVHIIGAPNVSPDLRSVATN